MAKKISIDLEEAKRVFDFLEKAHDLMHQPLKYGDAAVVEKFAADNYSEAKALYYDVVWEWLPAATKEEIERR